MRSARRIFRGIWNEVIRTVAPPVGVTLVISLLAAPSFAAPTVTAIAPPAGPTSGATPFTVTGTGFVTGATVKIGNVACTEIKVVSSTSIIGVNGAHAAGVVSVTVFNTASDSSATNSLYTYNSSTNLTKTTKAHFEAAGASLTNLRTVGLDSTLRWTNWSYVPGILPLIGNYFYVVTVTTAAGETRRSVETPPIPRYLIGQVDIQVNWTTVPGALRYKLYRTTSSGNYSSPALMATLETPGFNDTGGNAGAGAPPATNTATGDMLIAYGVAPATSFSSGPATTGTIARDAFSLQRPNGTFLIVHGNASTGTTIYDPVGNSMSAGPNTTGNVQEGAQALKRPNGTFLLVHGNASNSTSIYDPVANTMAAGPTTTANVNNGGQALERPDGKFLIVHGNNTTSTSIYDGVLNTMSAGPSLSGAAGDGAHVLVRPDGTFLIVRGNNSSGTTIYDGSANDMSAGPALTGAAGAGAHGLQRPDGRYLIVRGNSTSSSTLYEPLENSMSGGPALPSTVGAGGHAIQRANGTFLGIRGAGTTNTYVYDPVANTMSAGTALPANAGGGSHSLQLPDGQYLIIHGGAGSTTSLYDAGWRSTGSYVSEKLNPSDINFWNRLSWVRDLDDAVSVKLKTSTSSGGLDATSWRTVANGGAIGAGAGETWLQIGADYGRAIPKSSLGLADVWGRWRAEFRQWPAADLSSITANYTSTALSVSPSKTTFAFGARLLNTWVPPDSSFLRNNGTVPEALVAQLSTFTTGSNTWSLSPSTNGPDQIRAQWSTSSSVGPWSDIAAYDQNFPVTGNVAVSDSVKFFLRILTPTSTNSFAQYASTITVTGQ